MPLSNLSGEVRTCGRARRLNTRLKNYYAKDAELDAELLEDGALGERISEGEGGKDDEEAFPEPGSSRQSGGSRCVSGQGAKGKTCPGCFAIVGNASLTRDARDSEWMRRVASTCAR